MSEHNLFESEHAAVVQQLRQVFARRADDGGHLRLPAAQPAEPCTNLTSRQPNNLFDTMCSLITFRK